jgi:carbon monoxide dehydrogenase subunit G
VEGLDEREHDLGMTTAECSVEVDAPPEAVWEVTSDPRNLPHWDRHIVAVKMPSGGLHVASRYDVVMGFMGVRASVPCEILEWEPPWRAMVRLGGVLNATVTTSIASLPFDRSLLRHQIDYRFRGPLGSFAAASVNAVGGAQYALRRGTLAQKREIEARAAAR